jgi:class 3 adenylate cyclase
LEATLADPSILLLTERSRQGGKRQQVGIGIASLKRVFGIGETLATTLVGLASRIAAKICAYTYSAARSDGSKICGRENVATLI